MKEEISELSSRTRLMGIAKDVGLQMNDKNIRNVTKWVLKTADKCKTRPAKSQLFLEERYFSIVIIVFLTFIGRFLCGFDYTRLTEKNLTKLAQAMHAEQTEIKSKTWDDLWCTKSTDSRRYDDLFDLYRLV